MEIKIGVWKHHQNDDSTNLQITDKTLKAFNGCSIFTTTYQIKKSAIVLDSVSIQKNQNAMYKMMSKLKRFLIKFLPKDSKIFYSYDANSKKIILKLYQEGRRFGIAAIKKIIKQEIITYIAKNSSNLKRKEWI